MNVDKKLIGEKVVRLYFSSTTRDTIKEIIATLYSKDARFRDAFLDVSGRRKVETQFVSMLQAFDEYQLKSYDIEDNTESDRININAAASYVIKGRTYDLNQQTQLTLNDQGLITYHHDILRSSFTETLDKTPVLREVYSGWRKIVGLAVDPLLARRFNPDRNNKE